MQIRFRVSSVDFAAQAQRLHAQHTLVPQGDVIAIFVQISWRIYDILSMLRRLWLRGLLNAITLIYTILFAALTGNNTAITQQITTATTTTRLQQLNSNYKTTYRCLSCYLEGNYNKTAAHCYSQCAIFSQKTWLIFTSLTCSLSPLAYVPLGLTLALNWVPGKMCHLIIAIIAASRSNGQLLLLLA